MFNDRTQGEMSDEIVQAVPNESVQAVPLFGVGATRAYVTLLLVAANVAVFVVMSARGVSTISPSPDALVRWGAMYGPPATHGQWWRVVTAVFVHVGIIHLAMNMYVLVAGAGFVERLFGHLNFFVLYMLAGIGGSITSLAVHPGTVSAGASGAIFGIYGGLLGFLFWHRHSLPGDAAASMLKAAIAFLGVNILYSVANQNVDLAAHLGGFLTGAATGAALAAPIVTSRPHSQIVQAIVVATAGIAIAAAVSTSMPRVDDLLAELRRIEALETDSVRIYGDALHKFRNEQIDADAIVLIVERDVLPSWNRERERLLSAKFPGPQRAIAQKIATYMSLRGDAWKLVAEGIRQDDEKLITEADKKEAEAAAIAKQFSAAPSERGP
jgi:membrane associated rhomboid family serine protease